MRRKLYLYALLIAIPAVTLILNLVAINHMDSEFEKSVSNFAVGKESLIDSEVMALMTIDNLCRLSEKVGSSETQPLCHHYTAVNILAVTSLIVFIVATLAFISISIIGLISRLGRSVLVALFRSGLYVFLLGGALILITDGILAVGTLYYAVAAITGRLFYGLMIVFGIAIVAGASKILAPAMNTIRRYKAPAFGKTLSRDKYPAIWKFVDDSANTLGSLKPDNIVVGLGEEYYVTESTVICLDGELKGRTMYLSLPLMHLLSNNELKSIVGHELGHFRGKDTVYSRHFYPIYRGTGEAIAGLSGEIEESSSAGSIIYIPAFSLLIHFMDVFSKIESRFSRSRELLADKAGAEITDGETFSRALTKIYAYSGVWSVVQNEIINTLSQGQQIINASQYCTLLLENADKKKLFKEVGAHDIPHPTDSHPPFDIRLNALGFDKVLFESAIGEIPSDPSIELVADYEEIEKELTEVEHVRLVQMGLASLPPAEDDAEGNLPKPQD